MSCKQAHGIRFVSISIIAVVIAVVLWNSPRWISMATGTELPGSVKDSTDSGEAQPTRIGAAEIADDSGSNLPGRFVLPDGFTIEQVAGPPLVRYPLFACFDDVGRLYVAEGTGQSVPGAELVNQNLGKITRLEDTNGDGQFDRSTLFADGFVFPQGVLWHDGVVYVASHPAIWRLEDSDGDGRADRRDELVGKFKFNGNGCDIHGPFLGPDGRLYWTDGRHGYRIEQPDGTCLEGLASRIWRCRTDGTELERLCGGGFDNPVEVAWTADGEMLGTMDQGAGDCLLHYVEGGVYPEEHPCVQEFARTGPLLGVAKRYSVELPAALCGTMRYRSGAFGPEFRDSLITTHYMTHKLVRSTLVRDGSTFRADDADFLVSSDPHLRLTDVLEDADGSLLVIDMGAWFTYGFLGNVLPRPEMLGAIYRIRRVTGKPLPDPRGNSLRLTTRSAADLVPLLDDPRPAVRDRVMDRLAKIGDRAVPALRNVLRNGSRSVEERANAVWTLCRIDGPDARSAVRTALDPMARERREPKDQPGSHSSRLAEVPMLMAAVHAAGLHRDAEATGDLIALLRSNHPPLARRAAEALGRIGKNHAVTPLLDSLRRPVDRFGEHSLIYALIQINDRDAVLPGLQDDHPRVRQGALIALDQMKDGQLTREQVVPLLDSEDHSLQHAALNVISRRSEWVSASHGVLRSWLTSPQLSAERQKSLVDLLLAGSEDSAIQKLTGAALASTATPSARRILVIGVLRQAHVGQLPPVWADGLTRALSDADSSLRWEAMATIRLRGWRQFDEVLREMGRDVKLSPELRVAALECLAGRRQPLDAVAFAFLIDQLSESTAALVRLAAARTLAASALNKDQLIHVANQMGQVNTMTLRLLLPVFAKVHDDEVGTVLLSSLKNSPAAEALATAELDSLISEFHADVRHHATPLRERIVARQRDQAAYLAGLTAKLGEIAGNADAGKEVFLAPKNNCFACHRAVGRGGTIGPDLSKIGAFRTQAELLESIIFPSHSIAPQYQTHTLATRDGRVATGLVVRETSDAILLRTADLAEHRVLRIDLEELAPSPLSIMPDGLEKTLTTQQLADLLEFLCQQR